MAGVDKKNQGLMKAIKAVHSMVEKDDIEKHRQSQDNIGTILSVNKNKEVRYEAGEISGVPVEWIRPVRKHLKKPIILYCHGGGYFTGSIKYARILTTKLACAVSAEVLCFDYRLAPEHPYPAAIEDAMTVWNHLMLLGYGSKDIIIAGDSAGGNMALSICLQLKDAKRILPKGLVLLSPWTDLTFGGESHNTNEDIDPVLDAQYLHFAANVYAMEAKRDEPYLSPLFGKYKDFVPVYIQVGENEVLLDDSVRLYEQLKSEGIYAKLDIYKGMWHVFQMSPFKAAYDAIDKMADFIFDLYDM